MDYRETEDQRMLRQMVRKFAENEIKPVSLEYDHKVDPKDCYPWDLLKKASKLGLRTLSIPTEYGGGGVKDLISYIITVEELGAGDNGFAVQKDEFFPKIVKDDTFVIADAKTEPNSGTDNTMMADVPGGALQTYAERKGDVYIVNGSKHFIANGGVAKLHLLHTRTDRKLPLNQSHSIFLVSPDTPGFKIGKFHSKLGRRLVINAELFFDDMRVPARYLVQNEGEAAKYLKLVHFQTFLIPATILGTFRACYNAVVDYARMRIQGGKPIIRHQMVAAEISEMRVRIEAVRALLYKQAWCCENKYEYDRNVTIMIRPFINQIAGHMAYQLQEIFGAPGVDKEMMAEKYTRDLLTCVHGPSTYGNYVRAAPDYQPEARIIDWRSETKGTDVKEVA
jgi:alkylation response protein AidB-like acyl-CoA dehydrogenase